MTDPTPPRAESDAERLVRLERDWSFLSGIGKASKDDAEWIEQLREFTKPAPDSEPSRNPYKQGMAARFLRLLSEAEAENKRLREENDDLQADMANDAGWVQSVERSFAELCQAVGIERGTENWEPWIASVRERFARLRAPSADADAMAIARKTAIEFYDQFLHHHLKARPLFEQKAIHDELIGRIHDTLLSRERAAAEEMRERAARLCEAGACDLRDNGPKTSEGILQPLAGARMGGWFDAAAAIRSLPTTPERTETKP